MSISWYPVPRMIDLIERVSKDLNAHLINVLGTKLMTMNYEDFLLKYKETKLLFKEAWTNECELTKKQLPLIQKIRGERSLSTMPLAFEHMILQNR